MDTTNEVATETIPPVGELEGFFNRLGFAFGPLVAGMILDVLDFATFGPIGLVAGAVVGGYAGWILARFEHVDPPLRTAIAICAAAYMMIPFTEVVPAATILVLLARFFTGPKSLHSPADADSIDRQP